MNLLLPFEVKKPEFSEILIVITYI